MIKKINKIKRNIKKINKKKKLRIVPSRAAKILFYKTRIKTRNLLYK